MRIGSRITRAARPVFGIAMITPIVLAGAVGAAPGQRGAPVRDTHVRPLASVSSSQSGSSGSVVVALNKPPRDFHFAGTTVSAPPPAIVVNSPGSMRIPAMAVSAYRNAEQKMATASPGCGVSWNLLAGIGRIESMHANGGATDARGTALRPIYGPTLDGTLPGNEVIVQNNTAGRAVYARAMGPMQFLPGTWSRYAVDGDGDGKADPQNLFDATLAAARYLCSGGLNLRNQSQVLTAILRYNNSMAYAQNVLGWAAAYATGVEPLNLPSISGPIPAIGDLHLDAHLENRQGLGPGMPLSATGLPANDPLAQLSLLGPASAETPGSHGPLPGPASMLPGQANCEVICLGSQAPLQVPAEQPVPGLPFWMTPSQDPMLPTFPEQAPLPGVMAPPIMAPPIMGPADPFLPAPPPAAAEEPLPGLPPTFGAAPGPAA